MNNEHENLKEQLIYLLNRCTESQREFFKKMYSYDDLGKSIEEIVDGMDSTKLEWAIIQAKNSI